MHHRSLASRLLLASLTCPLPAQLLAPPQATAWAGPTDAPAKVALGDVDLDGRTDIVVFGLDGSIHVLLGDGLGGFPTRITTPVAASLNTRASLLDTNADGYLDTIVSTTVPGGPSAVNVLLGDGSGTFTAAAPLPGIGLEFHTTNLDGDEHPDALSVAWGQVVIAFGTAPGGFLPAVAVPAPPGGPGPLVGNGYLSGDVDGDGTMDLVVLGGFGPAAVMYGDGDGHFSTGQSLPIEAITPRALADFDGDGRQDIVARDIGGALVLAANGPTGFGGTSPILGASANYDPAAATDLDGDGNADVVAGTTSAIQVLLGDGTGSFAPPQTYPVARPRVLAIGDLDSDGRADVVSVGEGFVRVFRNLAPTFAGLAGYGTGTPACGGTIGVRGTRLPRIGTGDFRIQFTNVPPASTGLLLAGTPVAAGWEPPGPGLRLPLGLRVPGGAVRRDLAGTATRLLPIPNSPWLIGAKAHLQSVWLGDPGLGNTCSSATHELASSRGLRITLQP